MRETIEVTIKADGTTVIEGKNFTGSGCEKATKELEKALGSVSSRKNKPEYYETEKVGTGISIKR